MKKLIRQLRIALFALAMSMAATTYAATPISVTTYTELRNAIDTYNTSAYSVEIVVENTIVLQGELPEIKGAEGVSLTITGAEGAAINGNGTFRGLVIDTAKTDPDKTGTVTVSSLNFVSCVAKGGNGGSGVSGGGGGMGAGGAIYAKSGEIVLNDVTFEGNAAVGGNGGNVLQKSNTFGGGGGIGGAGQSGAVDSTDITSTGIGGNGGGISSTMVPITGNATSAGSGGGYGYTPYEDEDGKTWNQVAHNTGTTGVHGGDGGYGGGGAGSTYIAGDGGLGGGGGAGNESGGIGGFGGGGGGGVSTTTAGVGGFAAGNGGYQESIPSTVTGGDPIQGGGLGGGGAALGGALYVEEGAKVSFSYSADTTISGNVVVGGGAGVIAGTTYSGTAQNGEGIGSGIFMKDDIAINVADTKTVTIKNDLGGYAGATLHPSSIAKGGLTKTGDGTLILEGVSSYTGTTVLNGGELVAGVLGSLNRYSSLEANNGSIKLSTGQSVQNIYTRGDESGADLHLNRNTLTILQGGTGEQAFKGQIFSRELDDIQEGEGSIIKQGTGILRLGADSRGSAVHPEIADYTNNFFTLIYGGTVVADVDGAFGDGTIAYYRKDSTDTSKAIAFGTNVTELDNMLVFYENTTPLRMGASADNGDENFSVSLNGRIFANPGTDSTLHIVMNDADQTVTLTNTGVSADRTSYASGSANNFSKLYIEKGTVRLTAEKATSATDSVWYSSLGTGLLINGADGNTLEIQGDDTEDFLVIGNSVQLDSGLLSLSNTKAGQGLVFADNALFGAGGINVNMVDSADYVRLAGYATYTGPTQITNGILDLSELVSQSDSVTISGLATTGETTSAVVLTGARNLIVSSSSDTNYSGVITDSLDTPSADGIKVIKTGTGTWGLGLNDQGIYTSNVSAIEVQQGKLALIDNSLRTQNIQLTQTGGLQVKSDRILDDLNASVTGTNIEILENAKLTLSGNNTSTVIGSSLAGKGTLRLDNSFQTVDNGDGTTANVLSSWTLNGISSNWTGTIETEDSGVLKANVEGALNANSTVSLGDLARLDVIQSNALGSLLLDDQGEVATASNKTLTLSHLAAKEGAQGDLLLSGTGTVALNAEAASNYQGNTTIKGSTLKVQGNNVVESGTRGQTRLEGGKLVLDYSGLASSSTTSTPLVYNSLWGDETIAVGTNDVSNLTVTGNYQNVDLTNGVFFDNATSTTDPVVPTLEIAANLQSLTWSGAVEGKGNLLKGGYGTLVLNGSLATGAEIENMNVGAGNLKIGVDDTVNRMLDDSNVTVSTGATLSGWADTFKSLALYGNFDMNRTGQYTLNAAAGTNAFALYNGGLYNVDMTNATTYTNMKTENGNISLYGGTIHVEVDDAYKPLLTNGTTLTVLETENGTVSANAGNVLLSDNVTGKRLVATYGNKAVQLQFVGVDYTQNATSPEALPLAQFLNGVTDANTATTNGFINGVENSLTVNPYLLEEMTGAMYLSGMQTLISTQNELRQILSQSLLGSTTPAGSSSLRGQMGSSSGIHTWASFFGASGSFSGNTARADYDYSLMGGIFGAGIGNEESAQLGLFYSYANSKAETGNNLGNVNLDTNYVGTYLKWNDALGYGLVLGNFGFTGYEGDRAVLAVDALHRYTTDHDGWSGSVYLERGFDWKVGNSTVKPFLGLQYTHLAEDSFTEQAVVNQYNAYRLRFDDITYDSLMSVLGIRLGHTFNEGAARPISVFGYANWVHEFLETEAEGNASFETLGGGMPSFVVHGSDLGSDWVLAGLGADWQFGPKFNVFGAVDIQAGDGSSICGGNAGFKYIW